MTLKTPDPVLIWKLITPSQHRPRTSGDDQTAGWARKSPDLVYSGDMWHPAAAGDDKMTNHTTSLLVVLMHRVLAHTWTWGTQKNPV